jgi:hypothetical protein
MPCGVDMDKTICIIMATTPFSLTRQGICFSFQPYPPDRPAAPACLLFEVVGDASLTLPPPAFLVDCRLLGVAAIPARC